MREPRMNLPDCAILISIRPDRWSFRLRAAAEAILDHAGVKAGVSIRIRKRIPIAAGLGGWFLMDWIIRQNEGKS